MLYTIKLVSKNELMSFRTDKKGKIISTTGGVSIDEVKKYVEKFDIGAPVDVFFRINEWKRGKKVLVIEDIYNRTEKRFATPYLMEALFDITVDWLKPIKMCNCFEGTLEEARETAERLAGSQLKLTHKNQLKRSRHVFYLPVREEQPTERLLQAQREHYKKEMK